MKLNISELYADEDIISVVRPPKQWGELANKTPMWLLISFLFYSFTKQQYKKYTLK